MQRADGSLGERDADEHQLPIVTEELASDAILDHIHACGASKYEHGQNDTFAPN